MKKTSSERIATIESYWRAHPTATYPEIQKIFHVGTGVLAPIHRRLWPKGTKKAQKERDPARLATLQEVLTNNPSFTARQVAAIVGRSETWVWIHAPKGWFSGRPRGTNKEYWNRRRALIAALRKEAG